ncbi:MAG: hypothetical protein WBD38_03605 [Candidatus Dormiibacterota bacterium]
MSQAALDDVISRMAVDPGFHALVRADPTTALAAFDLTEDERLVVLSLAPDHDVHATKLLPRSSKSALFFGTALHDAAAIGHDAGSAAGQSAAHAASHAASGASPVEQAVTWVTAMDHPGGGDPEAQAISGATNVVQSQGGQAADEAEEEIEEEIQGIEQEIEAELGGQPPEGIPPGA